MVVASFPQALLCDKKSSHDVKHGHCKWAVDRWRKDEEVVWQAVQSPPLLPGPTTLTTSRRVSLKRMLCARSCSALSQPQLYHFKSLAPELLVYKLHSIDCMAKSKSAGWSKVHTAHTGTLVITLGNTRYAFSAQGCHLVALNSTMLVKRCTSVALTLIVKLTAFLFLFYLILSMVWVSHSWVRWESCCDL